MPDNRDICEAVCTVATRLGYRVKELTSSWGTCYIFCDRAGRSVVNGPINKDRRDALTAACKELMPHIAHEFPL